MSQSSERSRITLLTSFGLSFAFVLLIVAAGSAEEIGSDLASEAIPSALSDEYNLINNPSFEGPYHPYDPIDPHPDCQWGICITAQMATGWTPFWVSHDPSDPEWIIRMPEYKGADPAFTDPLRVRSGDTAQQYFTFFSTHEAGFYQQVDVIPGAHYQFGIWGHSWSADDDENAYTGPFDGILSQKVGIDPHGGDDWQSDSIAWSLARQQPDFYDWFEVEAEAQSAVLTVLVHSNPEYAVKHNDVYWDDARLVLSSSSITPASGIASLADIDEPRSVSYKVSIHMVGDPSIQWLATLEPGGTLDPTLSPLSGAAGDDLTVEIDSTGLALGTYDATLIITADPLVAGSPYSLPIRLLVVEEIFQTSLPVILYQ